MFKSPFFDSISIAQNNDYLKELSKLFPNFPMTSAHPLVLSSKYLPFFNQVVSASYRTLLTIEAEILRRKSEYEELSTLRLIRNYTHSPTLDKFPVFRIDTFFDANTGVLKILEFNTGDPSGLGWADAMTAALVKTIPEAIHTSNLRPIMMTTYLASYLRQKSKREDPTIAIVSPNDSTVRFDHVALKFQLSNFFEKVLLIEPADVCLMNNVPHDRAGNKIDVLIRDAWDEICNPKQFNELQKTIIENKCLVINPLSSNIGDEKLLMCKMKESEIGPYLPLTYKANDIKVSQKDSWVLKPSYGYGGYGVTIGKDVTEEGWRRAYDLALNDSQNWIIQQFVSPPKTTWRSSDGNILEKMNTNLSLWSIGGVFAGAFARLSQANVINVHQGGAFLPVLWQD